MNSKQVSMDADAAEHEADDVYIFLHLSALNDNSMEIPQRIYFL